eukprot:gene20302-8036_t
MPTAAVGGDVGGGDVEEVAAAASVETATSTKPRPPAGVLDSSMSFSMLAVVVGLALLAVLVEQLLKY